jgi:hypothetical protein
MVECVFIGTMVKSTVRDFHPTWVSTVCVGGMKYTCSQFIICLLGLVVGAPLQGKIVRQNRYPPPLFLVVFNNKGK